MRIRTTRLRVIAAALTLCGAAATVTVAETASASPAATGQPAGPAGSAVTTAAARSEPVLINCLRQGDVRPGGYVFTCADANTYLTGLHWASWTSTHAFAVGTYAFNDCIPSCVQGHLHSFPALVVVWRPEPWPAHPGAQYFSRMTFILNGNRTYTAGGQVHHLPVTTTGPLSTAGG